MFNRSFFNLQRYNLPSVVRLDIHIRSRLSAIIAEKTAGGANSRYVLIANSAWGAKSDGTAGLLYASVMSEAMRMLAAGCVNYYMRQTQIGAFGSSVHLSLNNLFNVTMGLIVDASGFVNADVRIARMFSAAMREAVTAAKTYRSTPITFAAIIDAQATTYEFDIHYANIAITLHPGEILVIDGDNYTVMHGSENVISEHTGAWPTISREGYDIQITSGTLADLEATLLYTERYL